MSINRFIILMAALVVAVTANGARAEISIDMVPVRNAGNDADSTGYGAVAYDYWIGKYEVTAGQYRTFLNAVAATDTYGLYNTNMWSSEYGCKIQQSGSSGSYTYSVAADRANRPVNYVSWGDTARFMNWLHNDQPTGAQGLTTTEDGAYYLNGATTNAQLMGVTRKDGAKYWIPTENEWYKAAYYDPNKPGGPGYWDYPTGSDDVPSNQLTSPDPGNNANFRVGGEGYSIGDPYWMTEVGEFENSESPYGTFDQGGNVWEYTEAADTDMRNRRSRGACWDNLSEVLLRSSGTLNRYPDFEASTSGFRVATVPEPGSITLLLCGGLAGLFFWRRRRRT